MVIHNWGYLDEYRNEREELLAAVDRAFSSGRLILGEGVSSFEEEFADHHGVAHCVGVDNGTNAIVLALRALGVGAGDEVVTVANTAAQTVVAIDAVGAVPVFADVDPKTHLIDTDHVASLIGERTRCLLPVHLYGQCADMTALVSLARRHGLAVIEDCAQSHGARHEGRLAGTMGDAGTFSFYPTKVLGAYGDAGAVLTGSPEAAESLRTLRYCGMRERFHVDELPGYNSRLDEVQAEILRVKLPRLDTYVARRRELAERYDRAFAGTELALPVTADGNDHVYYLYVVRHPRRDALAAELERRGVQTAVHYPRPVHLMSGFAHLGHAPGSLPVTEAASEEILSLPLYPSLDDADQERIITAVCESLDAVSTTCG
ncbi:DegT/DnrJ/EryC1/StrS aminotransferase family protein [Nocardiopsis sp. JB363]|uniref:DegT/DnrJ/EryC1/StrS family aminotransferase n=1 Tax=Nocardiopsis sp. JB363 TaxID=1434837 RepID=UPI00097A52FC|nr:DegT/DnrJ/EryC1/StrS family aminotransferase [Nocardiopsis sp. JB363]SIO91001.1 Aminotransferase [Nocardiopsis sp. JB363]